MAEADKNEAFIIENKEGMDLDKNLNAVAKLKKKKLRDGGLSYQIHPAVPERGY